MSKHHFKVADLYIADPEELEVASFSGNDASTGKSRCDQALILVNSRIETGEITD